MDENVNKRPARGREHLDSFRLLFVYYFESFFDVFSLPSCLGLYSALRYCGSTVDFCFYILAFCCSLFLFVVCFAFMYKNFYIEHNTFKLLRGLALCGWIRKLFLLTKKRKLKLSWKNSFSRVYERKGKMNCAFMKLN